MVVIERLELTAEKLYTNSIVQSCFSVPALAPEGSRSASCQIRPEQQGVRSLFFHLSSFSSWPLAPKELFVSGQQRAQYPPGDPDPPSHRGASASDGPRDWKLSVGCWHQVNPGLVLSGSALVWPRRTEKRDQHTDVWALTTQGSTGHLAQRPVEFLLISILTYYKLYALTDAVVWTLLGFSHLKLPTQVQSVSSIHHAFSYNY